MALFKILDGAMGSELIRKGLTLSAHNWSADANIIFPEIVLEIHKEYVDEPGVKSLSSVRSCIIA